MADKKKDSIKFEELRNKAEKLLQDREFDSSDYPSDLFEFMEELRVHQAELELQNEELNNAQQEISKLRHEYEALYEFAPCGYITLSSKGIITLCNLSGVALLGVARSNLESMALSGFVTRNSQNNYFRAFSEARQSGELQTTELEIARQDGESVWVQANIQPEQNEEGTIEQWRITLTDITKRKQMEEAIKNERAYLSAVIDNIQEAIVICDAEGRIVRFNETARRLHGLPEEPIPSDQWAKHYDLYQEDGITPLPIEDIPLFRALQGEQVQNAEIVVAPKHSRLYYLACSGQALTDETGQITGAVVAMHDITERRQAEEALRESEQRFKQWFESSPISLWEQDFSAVKKRIDEIKAQNVKDLDSYFRQRPELVWELAGKIRVLDVNQASLNLYRATSKEEFLGGITKVFSRESLEGFLQVLKVIAVGEKRFVTEREHVTLYGDPLKVQLYLTVAKGHEETYSRILVSIVDITDRKEAKDRLQAAHNKLDTLVQLNADGLMVLDQDGIIHFLNPAAAEMLGRGQNELLGEQFGHPLIPGSNTEIELLSNSGEARVVELRGRETEWNEQTALLVSFRDITERKRAEERIYYLAYYDEQTDLPNRRLFHDRLKQVTAQCEHFGEGGVVFLVDVTRLREVNDSLGQQAGDELIRQVARRLADTVGEEDTVARVSGGEFMVLSEGKDAGERAHNLGVRILEHIGRELELSGRLVYPGVNIGFTLFPDRGTDPDTLIKQGDIALSEAKKSAHRIQEFAGQEDWISRQFHLEHDLKKALTNEEFFLCYQTQINLRTGRIVGLEALLRWEHPHRGIVSPGEFIPVLEHTGMIAAVDEWVIHRVCGQLKIWQEKDIFVKTSVNLSAQELTDDATIEVVRAALAENGVRAENLEVEITETGLMENVDRASRILQTLSSWGVRVALDDFGKGYSSLSYLQRLAINIIKIDKQFVDGLLENKDSVTLVQTIISMAHNLGKDALAEGVEREEQRQKLCELGCDYGQGFLWSRPQPVANLILT
ncbi:MAG: EAL domain-containing protein [Desulfovermiculus sp.]